MKGFYFQVPKTVMQRYMEVTGNGYAIFCSTCGRRQFPEHLNERDYLEMCIRSIIVSDPRPDCAIFANKSSFNPPPPFTTKMVNKDSNARRRRRETLSILRTLRQCPASSQFSVAVANQNPDSVPTVSTFHA